MSRMADSFHNISASYMMKNRGQEFVVMEDYMKSFGEKLAALDRISQRILKEEYGMFNFLRMMHFSSSTVCNYRVCRESHTEKLLTMIPKLEIVVFIIFGLYFY